MNCTILRFVALGSVAVLLQLQTGIALAQGSDVDLLEGLGEEQKKPEKPATEPKQPKAVPRDKKPASPPPAQKTEALPAQKPAVKPIAPQEKASSQPVQNARSPEENSRAAPSNKKDVRVDPAVLDKVKAVPRKPVLKKHRVELTPFFGVSLNDAFFTHMAVGGTAVFFAHDNFALGVRGQWLFAHPETDNVEVVRTSQISVPAVFDKPKIFGSLDFYWIPIYGKLSLFNRAIVPFDFYLLAGLGFAQAGDNTRPAMNWGVGQRFMLADWMALRFEVFDQIYLDTQLVNDQPRSDVQNFLMVQVGLSLFLPPRFEYGR
ncbi:MAG: outer membrane beta-barrel domain-containing protein [Myxococcota bacterium]